MTSDCIVCTTYFRRSLIEAGEDPDATVFNERELMVIEYGKQLAKEPNNVSDALYQRLASRFSAEELVTLRTRTARYEGKIARSLALAAT